MKESMLPLDTGVEYVVAENLRLNFPRHEIAIPFTEAGTKLGSNFREIAEKVNEMHDTFGLCGVLAVTVNGLLANPNAWQDVNFDPVELKTKFDNWSKNHTGDSAWMWFDKTHKNRFTKGPNDFAVLTETQLQQITPRLDENKIKRVVFDVARWQDALHLQEENRLKPPDEKLDFVGVTSPDLSRIFDQLADNEGIDIAVLCKYPVQKGIHTHWLAARRQSDGNKLLIAGDLKPFGIPAVGISVPIDDTLKAMGRVIGASPTTQLTKALAESNTADRNLHNEKMFLMNLVRRRF